MGTSGDCSSTASEALAAAIREASGRQLRQLAAQGVKRIALLRSTARPGERAGLVQRTGGVPPGATAGQANGADAAAQPPGAGAGAPLAACQGSDGAATGGPGRLSAQPAVGSAEASDVHGVEVVEYMLGSLDDPASVARELFVALRLADELGVGAVVVEGVLDTDEGLAVMNRLRKAASSIVRLEGKP